MNNRYNKMHLHEESHTSLQINKQKKKALASSGKKLEEQSGKIVRPRGNVDAGRRPLAFCLDIVRSNPASLRRRQRPSIVIDPQTNPLNAALRATTIARLGLSVL